MAGIESTPSKSNDWTQLSPCQPSRRGCIFSCQNNCKLDWIRKNLQEKFWFPDKAVKHAQPGTGWTAAELNSILQAHVNLQTFGCVVWESDLFHGVMCAMLSLPHAKEELSWHQPKGKLKKICVQAKVVHTHLYILPIESM
jgi:hypothetical protein